MASLKVEVVYALPDAVDSVIVVVPEGATLRQAVESSGILSRHPEIELLSGKLGIHGELRSQATAVADGDRIEIYRSLKVEPKDARRRRALKKS